MSTETVIEIRGVAKRFTLVELERLLELKPGQVVRRIEAVKDVSLTVEPGTVYGFLGPNGAGKTTTIKMCVDLIRPSAGTIKLWGLEPSDPDVKRRIGYMPEHPYFYDYLKPQEILDYFGRLFGLDGAERKKRIDRLIERVGLDHARNRSLRKFSKGMLQRLGVAQALINDPKLIVFDEPLSGLDPQGRKEIRDIIIEEREKGATIFFSSHILSDIEHLCDRVAIINQGVVVREGLLSELLVSGQRKTELVLRHVNETLAGALGDAVGAGTDLGAETKKIIVDADQVSTIIALVLEHGGLVDRVAPHRDSLEELFLRTTVEQAAS